MKNMEFTNSVSYYPGGSITCYPSSNAEDEGKLNLEYNMARLVTRVTSKNFCIVNPSFVTEIVTGNNGPQIKVGPGQASINGMDIIATDNIYLDPPTSAGTYYIYFQLCRDSSWNVKGDTTVGVVVTFDGLALTWGTEKLDDPDKFYLGNVNWNGTAFNNLVEDEDKYGRIWASDILSKVADPKHPEYTRLNLQEYIYKLPDWYMSKEGDIMYGPLILADDRINNNPGILMVADGSGSHITVKEPGTDNDQLLKYGDINGDGNINSSDITLVTAYINGTGTLTEEQKARADINHDGIVDAADLELLRAYVNSTGGPTGDVGSIYYIKNTNKGINADITKDGNNKETVSLELGPSSIVASETDNILKIKGKAGVEVSTGVVTDPKLLLADNGLTLTDPQDANHKIQFNIASQTSTFTLGKAIWQYTESDKTVSLLNTGSTVNYLSVVPKAKFSTHIYTNGNIYLNSTGDASTSYVTKNGFKFTNSADSTKYISASANNGTNADGIVHYLVNPNADGKAYFYVGNNKSSTDTIRSVIYDRGYIILQNNDTTQSSYPGISFRDGTTVSSSSTDVALQKVTSAKKLKTTGSFQVDVDLAVSGNETVGGTLGVTGKTTLSGQLAVTGAATFSNTVTSSNTITGKSLATSNGNLTIKGTHTGTITADTVSSVNYLSTNTNFRVAGALSVSGNATVGGNITATGTITGSKVYNAVYNGLGEIFRKAKDETIDYGDIVCVREDGLVHKVSSESDLNTIIGICSDTIGFELGGKDIPEDEQVEVEMLGQIWVKTDNTEIRPGQLVKALPNGKCDITTNKLEKLGIVINGYVNGKVRIVYTG